MTNKNTWLLDRRVPLAVIVTLLLQLGGALIWSAKLDARVDNLEQETINSSGLNEKFARLEESNSPSQENNIGATYLSSNELWAGVSSLFSSFDSIVYWSFYCERLPSSSLLRKKIKRIFKN
jgi:hypothetical protein